MNNTINQAVNIKNRLVDYWRLSPILLVSTVICYVISPTLYSLHLRWVQLDGMYSHGYLLLLVCLLVILHRLPALIDWKKVRWSYTALSLIPSLLWSFGFATQINVLSQVAFPLMILSILIPWTGISRLKVLLPPFLLFYLAIPVWEVLLPVLRNVTTIVATLAVRSIGIPAFIDGFSFSLPSGTVVIAGSCAGLSYFLMGLVLSSLSAMHRRLTARAAVLSVLILVALSLLGNWLRVIALILIAYYSKMQSPLVEEHGQFGWWIFAALFTLYLFLTRSFPEKSVKEMPLKVFQQKESRFAPVALLFSIILTVGIPFLIQAPNKSQTDFLAVSSPLFTPVTNNRLLSDMEIGFNGFDQAEIYSVDRDRRDWSVGRLVYTEQTQGKELVSDLNLFTSLPTSILDPVYTDYGYVNLELMKARNPKLIFWQYTLGKEHANTSFIAKWKQFIESIKGRPVVALWFSVVECRDGNCDEELAMLSTGEWELDSLISAMRLYE